MNKVSLFFYRLFPGMMENMYGSTIHKVQMEDAPAAPPTAGSLHQPMSTGTGVGGGMRERIAEEDRRLTR